MFKYIVFEGIDGVGKTTLAKAFSKILEENRYQTFYTFEPYGIKDEPTKMEDEIILMSQLRTFALDKRYETMPSIARELLLLANRAIHHKWLSERVFNKILISDRSFISGLIYKNMSNKTLSDTAWWEIVSKICAMPQLVIYVTANKQITDNDKNHFYDSMDKKFFHNLDQKYLLELMENEIISRIPMINFKNDFNISPEENAKQLFDYVVNFYKEIEKQNG